MQTIRFGLALDRGSGWHVRPAVGMSTVGPLGLLGILETQLGLVRAATPASSRVVQYRACLAASRNGKRFYERSFAVDELGTAARLLAWRDSWYLHGWTGQFPDDAPARLRDLAEVEARAATTVVLGPGQRLAEVSHALVTTRPQIATIELIDAWDDYPHALQRVLEQLPVVQADDMAPQAPADTLLRALQRRLLGRDDQTKQPLAWEADGSLCICRTESWATATQHLAASMVASDSDHALVLSSPGALLDGSLEAFDKPRLGASLRSPLRPALQLLPLSMQQLWEPLDYRGLLQFLGHPIHPMDHRIRFRLLTELTDRPGLGGPAWHARIAEIKADLGDQADTVDTDITRWIDHPRFTPEAGAPLRVIEERAEALASFFRGRLLEQDPLRRVAWAAACAQVTDLNSAVEQLLAQGETTISPEMLSRLMVQATGSGASNPMMFAQAGACSAVEDPAALVEPFASVTWCALEAPLPDHPTEHFPEELVCLEKVGVRIPSAEQRAAARARHWLRPLCLARSHLTLILPPPGTEMHPVWFMIAAHLADAPIESLESVLTHATQDTSTAAIPIRPLPARRRWWQLPAGILPLPEDFAFTRLEPFLFNPYEWALSGPAQLKTSSLSAPIEASRLLGTFAHRVVEHLYQQTESIDWPPQHIGAWFDSHFDRLVMESGAVLLMPGRRADLEHLRARLRRHLLTLHGHLQAAAVRRVEPERALSADTAIGPVHGQADLVVTLQDGRPVIIDMKWGSASRYAKRLKEAMHLQLALYAELYRQETGIVPQIAYYILGSGRLLTPAQGLFPGVAAIDLPSGATAALWMRMRRSFEWRAAQIAQGLLEVGLEEVPSTEESNPPDDGLPVEYRNPAYNPYLHLAGWEDGR